LEKLKRVILDTDPGSDFDDAYAIVLAANSPELILEGVTIVSALQDTRMKIARKLLNLCGRPEVPVYEGCAYPIMRKPVAGWSTFKPAGNEGKGFLVPEDDALEATPGHAADFIIEKVLEHPNEVTLIPVAELTNIALAIIKEPEIIGKIKEIVLMGGVINPEQYGLTPNLEHNLSSDPEATRIVFESGIPITVVSLNVTLKVRMTPARFEQLQSYHTPVVDGLVSMTKHWFALVQRDWSELHDPVAVGAVIDRSFITTKKYFIDIRMQDGYMCTIPHERIEFIPTKTPHIEWGVDVDGDRFWEFFLSRVTKK
jgi:purine nucleosidase